ncbi:MAG: T9SS type A sorting domain-containing protein [Candidatus Eisenbacteria bacterium]|uniref:T9SS type A sorting domain-containing protein n=1 Tax=Eiseniibacteriota bacterium TaxID=2212470 RepID=A0A7Y2E8Z0_UNCEI|nr:T9SS type A sorting domain-containing protein [Candidatus Eisenbacteria bacterium]
MLRGKLYLWIATLVVASLFVPTFAYANCSTASGVMMNQVRFYDSESPTRGSARLNALVELFNNSGSPVDVTGWTLSDELGIVKATLPTVSIPAQSYLIVTFGTGSNDLAFTNDTGWYYTNGDSLDVFGKDEGSIALYDDAPVSGTIQDYLSWAGSGTPPAGASLTDAINAGVWTAGEAVVADSASLFTLRLVPDGYDLHSERDWEIEGWGESGYGALVAGPNAVQKSPLNGAGFEPGTIDFSWEPDKTGDSFHVVIATDSTLASGVVFDFITTNTDTTLTLAAGVYYWRVNLIDTCGEVVTGPIWHFVQLSTPVGGSSKAGAMIGQAALAVTRQLQHKDTSLLCLYNSANNTRPGCIDAPSLSGGPWDAAHPAGHSETISVSGAFRVARYNCQHCQDYCARASINMINHFYAPGGRAANLRMTQDRIAFYESTLDAALTAPEEDIPHDIGMLVSQHANILSWALNGTAVGGPWVPTYAGIKAEIDAGRPVLVIVPGHAMVVSGYVDANTNGPGNPPTNSLLVRDPWGGTVNRNGLQSFAGLGLSAYWTTAAGAGSRAQEITVTTDSDGDGIMDFDEGGAGAAAASPRPRTLHSSHLNPDTDKDEVPDKIDIKSYTFHFCAGTAFNDPIGFADVDNDGLRAENDCDCDNGGQFDGGEDPYAKGICLFDSDPHRAFDDAIFTMTDKPAYFLGETVRLAGDGFHGNSTYPYDNQVGCPTLVDSAGLGSDGTVTTDTTGFFGFTPIFVCTFPGLNYNAVDVLKNGKYEAGDCQNPDVCWICLTHERDEDWDLIDEWPNYLTIPYEPNGPQWQFAPDFDHNGTGYWAAIDGQWQPGNQISSALRLPPLPTLQPDTGLFMTFWQRFFSQGAEGWVCISQDGGNNWTPIMQLDQTWDGYENNEVLDLTPYLPVSGGAKPGVLESADAADCILEFWFSGPPNSGAWFVDDVSFGTLPLGTTSVGDEPAAPPTNFVLAPNFPNPFSASTTIQFAVPENAGDVKLQIFDLNGRLVNTLMEEAMEAGLYTTTWDAKSSSGKRVAPGIYFYRLRGDGFEKTKKMTLIR